MNVQEIIAALDEELAVLNIYQAIDELERGRVVIECVKDCGLDKTRLTISELELIDVALLERLAEFRGILERTKAESDTECGRGIME